MKHLLADLNFTGLILPADLYFLHVPTMLEDYSSLGGCRLKCTIAQHDMPTVSVPCWFYRRRHFVLSTSKSGLFDQCGSDRIFHFLFYHFPVAYWRAQPGLLSPDMAAGAVTW